MKKVVLISPLFLAIIGLYAFSLNSPENPDKNPSTNTNKIQVKSTNATPTQLIYTEQFQERLETAVNQYFKKALRKKDIVGASVAIVNCNETLYTAGYGKRKSYGRNKINDSTVFRIGSTSKGFGAVLAGIHVADGLLNWDTKVQEQIPDFALSKTAYSKNASLYHLLSHSTGLPYHSFTNLIEEGASLQEIAPLFKKIKTLGAPGSIYSYQNAAYALSGTMIESVTNKTFESLIQEKIFEPLGMKTASVSYQSLRNEKNIAYPHKKYYGRWRTKKLNKKYYNAIAAGGVNASALDMSKWMQFLLGNNPDVMTQQNLSQIFTPIVEVPGKSKYYQRWSGHISSHYGLGWRIHTFKEKHSEQTYQMMHHGGYVNDFRSEIALLPHRDLGICVLFNSPTRLARTVIPDLYRIIQGITKKLEQTMVTTTPEVIL